MCQENMLKWLRKYCQKPLTSDEAEASPWYEFNSYLDCCASLGVDPRLGAWLRYQSYYRKYGKAHGRG